MNEAQRLKQLEDENGRLKRLVADLSLDREMLKAVIAKNGLSSLSLSSRSFRPYLAQQGSGVGAGEAPIWVSSITCAVAAIGRAGQSQARVPVLPGSGIVTAAEEAQTLCASEGAVAVVHGSEPGVGVRFCP